MEITLNKKAENHGHINIKFGESDYQEQFKEKLKEYGKKASLKGFRPGKVPAGLINKMYGKSIKVEEINRIVADSVQNYIKENEISLIGDPLPNSDELDGIDWMGQKEFEFNYEIGIKPDFEVPLNEKVNFVKYDIKVDDKILDKTILNIQKQSGERTDADSVNDKCLVNGTLKNADAKIDKKVEMDIALMSSKEQKAFIGKKAGESIEFDIQKAFEKDPDELVKIIDRALVDIKKMKGNFSFEIEKIEELKLAELNQELFDRSVGPDKAKDLESFKKEVKEIIQKNHDREAKGYMEREIQDHLLEKTKLDLPNEFLKKWLLVSNDGKITEDQIEKEYHFYEKELKWNLIINQIQKNQKFEVSHEDVIQETRNMVANQFGGSFTPEQMEGFLEQFVQNYLKENEGQNYMNVHKRLLDEKVMSWALDVVSTKEKKVSWEEFEKIVTK